MKDIWITEDGDGEILIHYVKPTKETSLTGLIIWTSPNYGGVGDDFITGLIGCISVDKPLHFRLVEDNNNQ